MCGLYYSHSSFKIKNINLNKVIEDINLSIKKKKYEVALKKLRQLRCNKIFVEIIKYNNKKIKNFLKQIKSEINRNHREINFDLLSDINWVIDKEIINQSIKIKKFIFDNNLYCSQQIIIFLRLYFNSIESLNYLETRGRDSASLSFNFKSKNKIKINNNNSNYKNFSVFQKRISDNYFLLNITIKYANQIGYSGENLNQIKDFIKAKKIFQKINFDQILGFFIIGHTRWASMGDATLSNCHPLINSKNNNVSLFYMNGDITNNYLIEKKLKKNKNFFLKDKRCNNDLATLPSLLDYNNKIETKNLQGSYVLFYHHTKKPDELFVLKKGSQGLYFSYDNDDNIILSSDVYGIVNSSNIFKRISNNKILKFYPFKTIKNENFKKKVNRTIISTRDLDKKKFLRFFTKEVNDTQLFLNRTIEAYINPNFEKIINMDYLFTKKIKNSLKDNKIRNIIITGMGSCYTAAVGISKYLSKGLYKLGNLNIKVQATIASEGSGFYLSENMTDTIVIVIAQSGTTIDTNVFASLAKKRGAYTIALANKRDGDITYIVQNSLYLGNGRDVELSVPSTKTYTCHLFLGFLLSEKILSIFSNKKSKDLLKISRKIKEKNQINNLIKYHSNNIDKINFNIFNYTNWVVVYDDSTNAYSSLELRIKLSECCYKSILYMNINKFKNSNLNNCLIFYIGKKNTLGLGDLNKNFLISISSKKDNTKLKNSINIYLKSDKETLLAIESAIVIQLVSYKISQIIDKSKINLKKNPQLKKIINFIVDKKDREKFNKVNTKNKILNITNRLKRPLDAIKHQAKTVTVGAIRESKKGEKRIVLSLKKQKFYDNIFSEKILNLKDNINLISDEEYEIEKYFFGNLIEYYNYHCKKNLFYNFVNIENINKNEKLCSNIFFGKSVIKKSPNNIYIGDNNLVSHKLIQNYLINDKKNLLRQKIYFNARKFILNKKDTFKLNLNKYFEDFNNVKFLGSGINYLVAKKYAQKFSMMFNKSIGYDVIENHKHVDISSESLVFIFASNIYRKGFQSDIVSEVKKFIAHDNYPIIFTNLNNNLFDEFAEKKINKAKIVKLPQVNELFSLSIFEFYFDLICRKNF